jgi:hypothetical protein
MPQNPKKPVPKKWSIWVTVITLALVAGFAAMAYSLLPEPYQQDFSLIGKGQAVVVLVHDHNVVQSMETMGAMNKTRHGYDGKITFLVADKFTPEGGGFADTYGVKSVAVMFFAPSGEQLAVVYEQQTPEMLRANLNKYFHL